VTFTYNPGSASLDDVRMLIGDTNPQADERLRLEDEEIARFLELEGSLYLGAAAAAEALAAKFAREPEGSVGPNTIRPSSRSDQLRAVAGRLRARAGRAALSFAGGISKAQKETAESNTDRIKPAFTRGMMDNPDAGNDHAQ